VAISDTIKEMRYIYYLLESIVMNSELCIMLRCDNVGAIFVAENSSSGVCTRQVDTRHHFIQEHIEDSFIGIVCMTSCDNDAELLTKM
jgi:hypothetical protein